MTDIVHNIFFTTSETFTELALRVFRWQAEENQVYKEWIKALYVNANDVKAVTEIPFLPVSLFKTNKITSGGYDAEVIFESSATTGDIPSRHYVRNLDLYRNSFLKAFNLFYDDIEDWVIIGLLPSYLERKGSSLVLMVEELVKLSKHEESGFYLNEVDKLAEVLQHLEGKKQKTLLIGVTFALLDFAEQYPMKLQHTIVMETGGMKGRRREMVREEVHLLLKRQFGIPSVHSEYGMTELLSQAYSVGDGLFRTPPWMKVLVREEDDPLKVTDRGRGLINVIDLANVHSCSFIATDDVGKLYDDGSFEVLGRMDNSDVRGCSLMVL